jgi:putative NADH-flavin reductase
MKILIYGATGATGHALVRQALLRGHQVTGFTRNPAKLNIAHENLSLIQGELANDYKIRHATKDHDVVISALGASSIFKFDQNLVDGVKNIIRVMEDVGTSRFIYMSTAGVKDCRHRAGKIMRYVLPKVLPDEIRGHEIREEMIRESKLKWTIVRPVTLTNGMYTGRFRKGEELCEKGFLATISRSDVAGFMLQQLVDDTFIRKTPLIMY